MSTPTLIRSICASAIVLVTSYYLDAQSNTAPLTLIAKAIALEHSDKQVTRYTYFTLQTNQNRTPKGKLFLDDSARYEWTWIGDLPYGRQIEHNGKPLNGKEADAEHARYDKAVADRAALTTEARAKAKHYTVVDSSFPLEPLLSSAYTLTELRQESLAGTLTHVIDCTPAPPTDAAHPAAARHITLWITDTGIILRDTYELIAEEPGKTSGSHGQDDFQLIDGDRLALHSFFHLNAPNGNTGDFESTFSRFRRFTVSVNITPADDPTQPPATH